MTRETRQRQTHYQVLGVAISATAEDIKLAYRRLAKQCHPDVRRDAASEPAMAERIRLVNEAYAVLRHAESRRQYDRLLHSQRHLQSQQATARAQASYRRQREDTSLSDEAAARDRWLKQVYVPLNRVLSEVLRSLSPQLRALSADPFDDELIEAFSAYLDTCRRKFERARDTFQRLPNPSTLAGIASRLYYSLNHLEDALDELNYFPLNFDDRHLHTGQELFRLAQQLRQEAVETLQDAPKY
ncbi:MAG: DnaJ domain-containing protein [Cyanobacteria bacterium J06642_2]